jgi:hypothetical protein
MLTYYPLDADFHTRDPKLSAAMDLAVMANAFQGREIHLAEVGYPSTKTCGHGAVGQAEFVTAFFEAWDKHKSAVTAVYWDWMTDWDPAAAAEASSYYGVANPCFAEYIGSLGLETSILEPKPALAAFSAAAKARFVH